MDDAGSSQTLVVVLLLSNIVSLDEMSNQSYGLAGPWGMLGASLFKHKNCQLALLSSVYTIHAVYKYLL
jgi:hypothetical protein